MRMIYAAVFGLTLVACSSNTEFKDGDNNVFTIDTTVDKDPTTVNNATTGPIGPIVIDAPNNAPGSFWIPATDDFVLRDRETGSLWNLRGEAFSGQLAGLKLEQVPSFNSFYFAWSVFYNGSDIWNQDQNATADLDTGDGSCLVPCDEIRQACGGGKDCIPALDFDGVDGRPLAKMVPADQASYLDQGSFVFGVVIDGEARAYPHNIFWWHEIYNDKIGDQEFTVSFCPLTGSGIVFAGTYGSASVDFGVSGNLYNSNLVMFDRQTDTLWSQMLLTGISGPGLGDRLEVLPVVETTWARWQQMWPDTLVASDDQGYSRDYDAYPYGDYRTNDGNTFRPTNPPSMGTYSAKERVLGLPSATTPKAFALTEMQNVGDRVVLNDEYEGRKIVVAYEKQHRLAIPFFAEVDGQALTFEGTIAP